MDSQRRSYFNRWFQYRLRTWFLFVGIVGVIAGWVAIGFRPKVYHATYVSAVFSCDSPSPFPAPDDAQVLRAFEDARKESGERPLDVSAPTILVEKEFVENEVRDPRVYPLVGPAKLHLTRYRCTIYDTRYWKRCLGIMDLDQSSLQMQNTPPGDEAKADVPPY